MSIPEELSVLQYNDVEHKKSVITKYCFPKDILICGKRSKYDKHYKMNWYITKNTSIFCIHSFVRLFLGQSEKPKSNANYLAGIRK